MIKNYIYQETTGNRHGWRQPLVQKYQNYTFLLKLKRVSASHVSSNSGQLVIRKHGRFKFRPDHRRQIQPLFRQWGILNANATLKLLDNVLLTTIYLSCWV